MTKILGLKPRTLPSRLNSGSWVGLKPGFPWMQEKDHLVTEFIFQRSEEEIWKKPSLCSNVSPSVSVSSSSPLGDPLPRASRASHLLLSAAFLCHLQPSLSLEGTRGDILLLLLWVARVHPNGPDMWTSALVTSNEELSPSKQLLLLLNGFGFSKFFTMSTPPEPWGSCLLRVPPGYSGAKSSTWESIPETQASPTLSVFKTPGICCEGVREGHWAFPFSGYYSAPDPSLSGKTWGLIKSIFRATKTKSTWPAVISWNRKFVFCLPQICLLSSPNHPFFYIVPYVSWLCIFLLSD